MVLGVSKDSVASHKKFAGEISSSFYASGGSGAGGHPGIRCMAGKNMYGKKVMGVVRSTYLVDNRRGIIRQAFTKVKAGENAEQMLGTL